MIEADADVSFARLARALEDRAAALAASGARSAFLASRQDPSRWRRADLLWPLFAKG